MMTYLWKGKEINDLSRDELIEVVKRLIEENAKYNTREAIGARAIGETQQLTRSAYQGCET